MESGVTPLGVGVSSGGYPLMSGDSLALALAPSLPDRSPCQRPHHSPPIPRRLISAISVAILPSHSAR